MACHACRDDRLVRLRLLMQEAKRLAEPIDDDFDYIQARWARAEAAA